LDKVTDSLGLCLENSFLTVYLPKKNTAFVFRVISRFNKGYEKLNYGPLPILEGESLATYEGGSTTAPADGVLPARSLTSAGHSFPTLYPGVILDTDMWYLTKDYNERIFHVIQKITPEFIRVDCQIPSGVPQRRFQKDKIQLGIETDWGFSRGVIEMIHFPEIHYGYRWGNDTNIDVITSVEFIYGEYVIEIPKDPELIFSILNKRIPSHWVTIPIASWDASIDEGLKKTYGFIGFPVYGLYQREKAIEEYRRLLEVSKV